MIVMKSRNNRMNLAVIVALFLLLHFSGITSAEAPEYSNWTEISAQADFGPRYDFGTAVFNNQLWVIGGHIQDGYLWGCPENSTCDTNDVWASPDGENWTEITDNASFSPRSGPGTAVFRDRLWVIGGFGKNDIWSSPDGKNWTLVTENAGFSPRGDAGILVFQDRLWVISGGNIYDLKNDVWSSPDGKNWSEVTGNAGFSPRYGRGVAVFDDRLWIIGGAGDSGYTDNATGYTYISEGGSNDVWSSSDGKNWTLVTADAPFKKIEFTSVTVFGDRLWIVGGGVWETMPMVPRFVLPHAFNKVWSSADGRNWTIETEDAGFSPRFLHGVSTFRNGIWVLGGTDNNQISGDIWHLQSLHTLNQSTIIATSSPGNSNPPVSPGPTPKAGSSALRSIGAVVMFLGLWICLIKRH